MRKTKTDVVYLVGAGATHASVKFVGYSGGILMSDLIPPVNNEIGELIRRRTKYKPLIDLANEIIMKENDIEQVITFLDESPSIIHREFAEELRHIFERVLKGELLKTKRELGNDRFALYSCLLDMYLIKNCPERLRGILSLNYDEYIEAAAKLVYNSEVDLGVVGKNTKSPRNVLKLLKLHGSFNWRDMWPIKRVGSYATTPLWIPPGLHKGKQRYPFGNLWGQARELLECDVLRIIGCRLSGNDWDLVSLLFATRLTQNSTQKQYRIEVIDSPYRANQLKKTYPLLNIKSILEIELLDVGSYVSSELLGGSPREYDMLTPQDKTRANSLNSNWFKVWLEQMAEGFVRERGDSSINTSTGLFRKILPKGNP